MSDRNVALYFAWNRSDEANAQLGILDNRWATIFETRRVNWPRSEHLFPYRPGSAPRFAVASVFGRRTSPTDLHPRLRSPRIPTDVVSSPALRR